MLDEDDGQDGPAATPLLPEPLDNCDVEPLLLPWPAGRVGTAPVLFTPIKTPGENRGKKVLESKENVVKVFFFLPDGERGVMKDIEKRKTCKLTIESSLR